MTRRLGVVLRQGRDGRTPGESAGFTVIELVISMALIGVTFAIFSVTMSSTLHTSGQVRENSALQGEVRAAVDAIARDLRQAYTGTGNPALETMTASQIQFLSPDRATPFHLRRVNYRLSTKRIQRASATSTNTSAPPWTFPSLGPYIDQVGSVVNTNIFAYYNASGVQTTTASEVAQVTVKLVVANPQNPARQFTYATSVALRVVQ
jgi:prepilin-type N-terminal cleavage/methylation domain-containing protein